MAAIAAPSVPLAAVPARVPGALNLCSFNIQFLGSSPDRLNEDLADLLAPCHLVVVQEVVAPPVDGTYPDGTAYTADPEAAAFFDAMAARGFDFDLSPEDTGPGETNHKTTSATEWFTVFFDPDEVEPAPDLPHGFLDADLTKNAVYRRVPYAHAFRTKDGTLDFVIINVHLWPDEGNKDKRKAELAAIGQWVEDHADPEENFLIVGDMNLYTTTEIADDTPDTFLSLNDEGDQTNTAKTAQPYDHVMYRLDFTTEIDDPFDQQEIDLAAAMEPSWPGPGPYPGNPYDHDEFRKHYSDHRPIVVRLRRPVADDD